MTTREITVDDLDNLRHMLGVSDRCRRGYRNYFVAGGDDGRQYGTPARGRMGDQKRAIQRVVRSLLSRDAGRCSRYRVGGVAKVTRETPGQDAHAPNCGKWECRVGSAAPCKHGVNITVVEPRS